MAKLSKATQRDIETIRETWIEFIDSLRTPWTYIPGIVAAAVVAVMMAAPWLAD